MTENAMITLKNASEERIFCAVDSERRALTGYRAADSHSKSERHSTEVNVAGDKKGPTGGGGKIGVKVEDETSSSTSKERQYEYQVQFGPMAGSRSLDPGESKDFTVLGEGAKDVFVSIIDASGELLRKNAPFAVATQGNLVWNDGIHVIEKKRLEVKNGATISLKFDKLYVGVPVWSKNWPCGNLRESKGKHVIHCANATIRSGDVVRITTSKDISGEKYVYLYSSDAGWIYYDRKSNNAKQFWYINKIDKDGEDDIIREGDKVYLTNKQNSQYYLRNYDGNWLSCEKTSKGSNFTIDLAA